MPCQSGLIQASESPHSGAGGAGCQAECSVPDDGTKTFRTGAAHLDALLLFQTGCVRCLEECVLPGVRQHFRNDSYLKCIFI